MIWKIISSMVIWAFYIVSIASIVIVFIVLFKIIVWDYLKKLFKEDGRMQKQVVQKKG